MHRLIVWVQEVAVPWLGAPGLFVACFLDSSFFSLPEISDILVVTSAAAHPRAAWLPVLLATAGSVAGSATVWLVGKRGGESYLARRFGRERVERTRAAFERWDVLALAVPAMLPPPVPFKIFVFSAGVFGIRFRRFATTLAVARGLRYVFWAGVGVVYGDEARGLLQAADAWFARKSLSLFVVTAILLAATLAAFFLWRRGRRVQEPPPV